MACTKKKMHSPQLSSVLHHVGKLQSACPDEVDFAVIYK